MWAHHSALTAPLIAGSVRGSDRSSCRSRCMATSTMLRGGSACMSGCGATCGGGVAGQEQQPRLILSYICPTQQLLQPAYGNLHDAEGRIRLCVGVCRSKWWRVQWELHQIQGYTCPLQQLLRPLNGNLHNNEGQICLCVGVQQQVEGGVEGQG